MTTPSRSSLSTVMLVRDSSSRLAPAVGDGVVAKREERLTPAPLATRSHTEIDGAVIAEIDDVERCERERVEGVDADVGTGRRRRAPHPCVPELETPAEPDPPEDPLHACGHRHLAGAQTIRRPTELGVRVNRKKARSCRTLTPISKWAAVLAMPKRVAALAPPRARPLASSFSSTTWIRAHSVTPWGPPRSARSSSRRRCDALPRPTRRAERASACPRKSRPGAAQVTSPDIAANARPCASRASRASPCACETSSHHRGLSRTSRASARRSRVLACPAPGTRPNLSISGRGRACAPGRAP